MAHDAPDLFRDYARWSRERLESLGVPRGRLIEQLEAVGEALEGAQLARDDRVSACLATGIAAAREDRGEPASALEPDAPHADLVRTYLDALLRMDRRVALQRVMDAAEGGVAVDDLYLDVFQPVLREVGRLWQTNRISVAVEHYCTAATQLAMAQLYPRVLNTRKTGRTLAAAGVSGDLHEVGIRMVSDLLELDGWNSVFLGTNVPGDQVADALARERASLLALSVSLTAHLGEAVRLIESVRAHPDCAEVRILVGGRPFLLDPDLWRRIGADATSPDARTTVEIARRLAKPSDLP